MEGLEASQGEGEVVTDSMPFYALVAFCTMVTARCDAHFKRLYEKKKYNRNVHNILQNRSRDSIHYALKLAIILTSAASLATKN
ncbi:hypothetical protein CEXT_379491 [Caerostris extrusa]|uniref:Uncharacterized protein n=1 Tax=Caerostris extrusa TaxID=172846 RepID=A0AAV4XIY8_CAEEX|nr:hypothetical protein CEXT_379491 [Caerostris extrusa]